MQECTTTTTVSSRSFRQLAKIGRDGDLALGLSLRDQAFSVIVREVGVEIAHFADSAGPRARVRYINDSISLHRYYEVSLLHGARIDEGLVGDKGGNFQPAKFGKGSADRWAGFFIANAG